MDELLEAHLNDDAVREDVAELIESPLGRAIGREMDPPLQNTVSRTCNFRENEGGEEWGPQESFEGLGQKYVFPGIGGSNVQNTDAVGARAGRWKRDIVGKMGERPCNLRLWGELHVLPHGTYAYWTSTNVAQRVKLPMAWEPPRILPIDDPTKPPIVNKDVLPPQITVDPYDAVGLDCIFIANDRIEETWDWEVKAAGIEEAQGICLKRSSVLMSRGIPNRKRRMRGWLEGPRCQAQHLYLALRRIARIQVRQWKYLMPSINGDMVNYFGGRGTMREDITELVQDLFSGIIPGYHVPEPAHLRRA
ncbi:uncharacterized protein LACBIDRAFT_323247 [Laccaria bicolor S238N-H82]|uniref:Predicted protein n=1 Tax=Laccaria bicolor (strain S238N-H82 / ATCC MYA-4686) TaxID=486041 RepID=B0CZL1_LACBS|nr:uncharacterized protein LACBIDRAFT_323247 [Laccaria bicolor S238N-H82]EDR12165.1 predicted protein [Laccaria bicolor S238N-H82]|eukprot:XP_001876429.1 predicted protein [Laccaria bicolor S238N-H82]